MDIDKILKIVLLLELVVFIFLYAHYKTGDCDLCKFELDGEEVGFNKVFDKFWDKCGAKENNDSIITSAFQHLTQVFTSEL